MMPFSVIRPTAEAVLCLLCPKAHAILAGIDSLNEPAPFGLVARYGLPEEGDLDWIRAFVGRCRLLFLGDLDPPDLLTFAWWRAKLPPLTIEHWGVSERFCNSLHADVPDAFQIQTNHNERDAVALMDDVIPDWPDIVGPRFAGILRDGRKIEIEAVVSTLGSPAPLAQFLAQQST